MSQRQNPHKILIVDDRPTNLDLLSRTLSRAGFKVAIATDGASALELAAYKPPELIVLDVMMPGMDGFETCRRLKANPLTQDIPVIFMTALDDVVNKVEGLNLGAVDYITKPFDRGEVLARIRLHLQLSDLNKTLAQQNQHLQQEVERRTQAEAVLREMNQELEAFSSAVSHDLRAPLRSLTGFSQALLEDYGEVLDPTGHDYLHRIQAAAQRMGQLIDDLIELARLTSSELQKQSVNLSQLATEIAEHLHQATPDQPVLWTIAPDLLSYGDPHLLQIVLENLLSNAWKFTSKTPSPQVEFGAVSQAQQQIYFIRDNGVGFDMTYADKLFGPFQRLHHRSEFPGTGIGLATTQRIIHRHQGKIWAEAAVNQGATFYFSLPELEAR